MFRATVRHRDVFQRRCMCGERDRCIVQVHGELHWRILRDRCININKYLKNLQVLVLDLVYMCWCQNVHVRICTILHEQNDVRISLPVSVIMYRLHCSSLYPSHLLHQRWRCMVSCMLQVAAGPLWRHCRSFAFCTYCFSLSCASYIVCGSCL